MQKHCLTGGYDSSKELGTEREYVNRLETAFEDLRRKESALLKALQECYVKHHMGIDRVGWDKLSDMMCDALCEAMGDKAFIEWGDKIKKAE